MKQGLRCGDLSFLLGPGGAASECRMVGKCRTQSAWTKALTVGWEWSTRSFEAWSCVSLHLGSQLALKQDTVEGSLRSVWCSADRLPSPTSEHPYPAPLPTGPHVKARLWPPYRKTALSSSIIRDGQPLSPEAPRVDKGSSLALTSSCLGRLLQT